MPSDASSQFDNPGSVKQYVTNVGRRLVLNADALLPDTLNQNQPVGWEIDNDWFSEWKPVSV